MSTLGGNCNYTIFTSFHHRPPSNTTLHGLIGGVTFQTPNHWAIWYAFHDLAQFQSPIGCQNIATFFNYFGEAPELGVQNV